MSVSFTTYSPATGELQVQYSVQPDDLHFYNRTPYIMGHHDGMTHFYDVKSSQVLPRPELPSSLRTKEKRVATDQTVRLTNIPKGATIAIERQSYTVDDGIFEWSSPIPMETELSIECFPYIPSKIKVVVTA